MVELVSSGENREVGSGLGLPVPTPGEGPGTGMRSFSAPQGLWETQSAELEVKPGLQGPETHYHRQKRSPCEETSEHCGRISHQAAESTGARGPRGPCSGRGPLPTAATQESLPSSPCSGPSVNPLRLILIWSSQVRRQGQISESQLRGRNLVGAWLAGQLSQKKASVGQADIPKAKAHPWSLQFGRGHSCHFVPFLPGV